MSLNTSVDAVQMVKKYKPGLLVKFFRSGFISKFIAIFLVFVIAGRFEGMDFEVLLPFLIICVILFLGASFYPLLHVKLYLKRHKLEQAIREDSGYMNVAISAFNLCPYKSMLSYIRKLNPQAAKEIERQQAERKK